MHSLLNRIRYFFLFMKSLHRTTSSLKRGIWRLTRLEQPAITVFGGSRLESNHPHSKKITDLAHKLTDRGFSIITGGGPGIMEAANLGAMQASAHKSKDIKKLHAASKSDKRKLLSLGIGVQGLEKKNKYVQDFIALPYFFARKWLLTRYSVGFVVGPGGFGTLDELAEILTLIQTNKMPRSPIILIGSSYWEPLRSWIYDQAVHFELLSKEDAALLTITDDIEKAFSMLVSHCTSDSKCAIAFAP